MKKLFFFIAMAMVSFASAKTPIITKWETYDGNIKVRSIGSYSYTWQKDGDTSVKGNGTVPTGVTTTITIPSAGKYILEITPDASFRFVFDHGTITTDDRYKLRELAQWGDSGWNTNMSGGFYGCYNLKITATDIPNFSGVTDMSSMFYGCSSITHIQNINQWNTASVTNMQSMFSSAANFNGDMPSWNTAAVTNMQYMFSNASNFNGDISKWNTSSVFNMDGMFGNAKKFNSDISGWNTPKVTTMYGMFENATSFNQDISKWNVSNVNFFGKMFNSAGAFNQNLGTWNIKNSINTPSMFDNSGLDCINYGKTLYGWSTQNISGKALGAKNLIYGTQGKIYRDQLIANGWTITGDFYDDSCTGSVLGLNETQNKIALQMFPNPTADYFKMNSLQADMLSLYDMSGKLMKTQKLTVGQNTVDISNFPKGVYIAKTANASAKIIKK